MLREGVLRRLYQQTLGLKKTLLILPATPWV